MVKLIIILIINLFGRTSFNQEYTYINKEINIFKKVEIKEKVSEEKKKEKTIPVLATYKGGITAYGPDCKGCSGITASGYNVHNRIYYQDKEYGKIRILAADKSLPFGTIVRIKDLKNISNPIIGIVLDRGSAIGFNKKAYFDLLYESELKTASFGRQKATFEILRRGY